MPSANLYSTLKCGSISVTFGDVAENHVRMQKLGEMAEEGLTREDLERAKERLQQHNVSCEIIDLNKDLEVEAEDACVLVIRNGVSYFVGENGARSMLHEQASLDVDKKALMRGKVVNKRARYNLCFADTPQDPDIESGKGRVVSFTSVPCTRKIRDGLSALFGSKANALLAEGNYYFEKDCGIGYHGDAERRIVIAARLGTPIPLQYQWFQNSLPIGPPICLSLAHGDMYAMSQKAVGTDWLKKKTPTLRHAAGASQYLSLSRFEKRAVAREEKRKCESQDNDARGDAKKKTTGSL